MFLIVSDAVLAWTDFRSGHACIPNCFSSAQAVFSLNPRATMQPVFTDLIVRRSGDVLYAVRLD